MVILRDGRKLLGVFRSYDQFGMSSPTSATIAYRASSTSIRMSLLRSDQCFHLYIVPHTANFLLEGTVERLHYKLEYADRDIGTSPRSASSHPSSPPRLAAILFIFV